jgi:hypothetical protein
MSMDTLYGTHRSHPMPPCHGNPRRTKKAAANRDAAKTAKQRRLPLKSEPDEVVLLSGGEPGSG